MNALFCFEHTMAKISLWVNTVEISTRCFVYNSWERERVTWANLEEAKEWYDKEFWEVSDIKDREECNYKDTFLLIDDDERIVELDNAHYCQHEWNWDREKWKWKVQIREYLVRHDCSNDNAIIISTAY